MQHLVQLEIRCLQHLLQLGTVLIHILPYVYLLTYSTQLLASKESVALQRLENYKILLSKILLRKLFILDNTIEIY